MKKVKKKKKGLEQSTLSLLEISTINDQKTNNDDDNDNDCNIDENKDEIDNEVMNNNKPEIFIDSTSRIPTMNGSSKSFDIAMLNLSKKSEIYFSTSPSLEEFLSTWDESWTEHQIVTYFSKYLTDPRLIALDKIYKTQYENDIYYSQIPKDVWRLILDFEMGSSKNVMQKRYFHWISNKRKEIYWCPYILGAIEFLCVFLNLFYIFIFKKSVHDAADVGTDDVTGGGQYETEREEDNKSVDYDNISLCLGIVTITAAIIHIIGSLIIYYFARFKYCEKLKRVKKIIYLSSDDINKKNSEEPQLQIVDGLQQSHSIDGDDENKESDNDNADNNDNDDSDEKKNNYETLRDLPNVEINFDINQVPHEYRHVFLKNRQKKKNKKQESIMIESDSDNDNERDEGITRDDNENNDEYSQKKQSDLRLKYMMGITPNKHKGHLRLLTNRRKGGENELEPYYNDSRYGYNNNNNDSDNNDDYYDYDDDDIDNIDDMANSKEKTLEEMQLILSGWEAYISFQRWINISSLVVTDNLSDPYLIFFLLHKYLFVIAISLTVFGLTTYESLIPFIILFISFSFLGLIVLDRINVKKALIYILSMVGCCTIIIGLVIGVLTLLSFLFTGDDNSGTTNGDTTMPSLINNNNNNTTRIPFVEMTSTEYDEIIVDYDDNISTTEITEYSSNNIWWITDFFYPMLAFIVCSNTIRRIRRGFDRNLGEIKYLFWRDCFLVTLILIFLTNSATWNNSEIKLIFLSICIYMGYLTAQQRVHQAVTRLRKIEYANKYLLGSKWVKTYLLWSWLGQLSNKFE